MTGRQGGGDGAKTSVGFTLPRARPTLVHCRQRLHVKPGDVSKALSGAKLDTIYGPGLTMRAADNQLVLPNYVGRAKVADGVLRPVIEQSYPASLTPPASALCKM